MPYKTFCLKCKAESEPFLDKDTDKVFCSKCEEEFAASHFVKIQLKTLKQFKPKNTKSFTVICSNCKAKDRPNLISGKLFCPKCKKEYNNLSEPYKYMLLQFLPKLEES